jgi:Calcineurin-like phosphoesterase/Glycosyl hydrolase family 99/Iron/zinc purple acid phosphatase-like protein C
LQGSTIQQPNLSQEERQTTMKRSLVAWCLALLLSLCHLTPMASAALPEEAADGAPVLAYYYQWFSHKSWDRAKIDYPLAGRYSSDNTLIMKKQISEAKSAGINGFIVSWKSTPTNNRRLEALIRVARAADFKLAVIYQGLDFSRKPLPVQRIADDMQLFKSRYASDPVFDIFAKPLLIWSGTWAFSDSEIERVTTPLRGSAVVLATEKSPEAYRRVARYFDGNAYYWSSVDPATNGRYQERLNAMAATVHKSGGLWIAPFAPGFDAQLVGGTREVPRRDGQTLRMEYNAAVSSSPDALGLISWNEFSENTHVEPSERYGSSALQELTSLVRGPTVQVPPAIEDSDDPGKDGILSVGAALLALLLLAVALPIYARVRHPRAPTAERPKRQARRSPWRILVVVVVVAVLVSLTAVGVVYARRPRDAGATPLYIGAQAARDSGSVIIGAAGDIACPPGRRRNDKEFNRPNSCGMESTAKLLGTVQPDAVLALGDNQYPGGSLADFEASYANSWGKYREITFPVPGNHEYGTPAARGYFAYFGRRAGEVDKGYYSYDLGGWHLIALNSECQQIGGCSDSDPQATWLRQDLKAHPRKCVLAYWHRPRFSSGTHGNAIDQDALWRILAVAHADVVLSGHDHDYERFTPMNADAEADSEGVTQFVVGTGGASHYKFHNPESTSTVRITGRNGVLRMQLAAEAFSWQFIEAQNGNVLDSGDASCH